MLGLVTRDDMPYSIMKATNKMQLYIFSCGAATPTRVMASSFLMFLDHTQRRTTVGRTPLNEWSARRRHLYLTTHNTHNRQTSMSPLEFEPMISAGERPQTYALDRAATGTGRCNYISKFFIPGRLYMFRAMFSPIIRSIWLYLQYLVVFTQVAAGVRVTNHIVQSQLMQDPSQQQIG